MAYMERPAGPPGAATLVLGVVFPTAVIAFEFLTGFCAGFFFDPLPTLGHLLAVSAVPAVNYVLWRAARAEAPPPGWLLPAAGATLLVSLAYVILFLPILPFAIVATAFLGIGFLPIIFNEEQRAAHDLAAGTIIVAEF